LGFRWQRRVYAARALEVRRALRKNLKDVRRCGAVNPHSPIGIVCVLMTGSRRAFTLCDDLACVRNRHARPARSRRSAPQPSTPQRPALTTRPETRNPPQARRGVSYKGSEVLHSESDRGPKKKANCFIDLLGRWVGMRNAWPLPRPTASIYQTCKPVRIIVARMPSMGRPP
jgi:hypothetical protein